MPINYKDYDPDWKNISKRIRFERAGNKCEWCGIKNGEIGFRDKSGKWYSCQEIDDRLHETGYDYFEHELSHIKESHKWTKIVLTVAHLDHDTKNNSDENLAALCQSCHLNYDMKRHVFNRKHNPFKRAGQESMFDIKEIVLGVQAIN